MSAHLPGPWVVSPIERHDERVEVRSKNYAPVAVAESLPDAKLIAAAPELLTALERIITEATGHTLESLDQARAAIAKARGAA